MRKSILPIELWTVLRLLRNICRSALPGHTHIDLQICRLARRLRNATTTMLCGGHGVTHSTRRNRRLPVIHWRLSGKVLRLRLAVTDMLIRETGIKPRKGKARRGPRCCLRRLRSPIGLYVTNCLRFAGHALYRVGATRLVTLNCEDRAPVGRATGQCMERLLADGHWLLLRGAQLNLTMISTHQVSTVIVGFAGMQHVGMESTRQ